MKVGCVKEIKNREYRVGLDRAGSRAGVRIYGPGI